MAKVLDHFDTDRHAVLILPLLPKSVQELKNTSALGTLGDEVASAVMMCTLSALAALAGAGWSHGDIKPSNLMLNNTGEVGCVCHSTPALQAVSPYPARCGPRCR